MQRDRSELLLENELPEAQQRKVSFVLRGHGAAAQSLLTLQCMSYVLIPLAMPPGPCTSVFKPCWNAGLDMVCTQTEHGEWVGGRVGQVIKDWEGTPQPQGKRTNYHTLAASAAMLEALQDVVLHTLTVNGLGSYACSHELAHVRALSNEPHAPSQMLHYDLRQEHRALAVTVDIALWEGFMLRCCPPCYGTPSTWNPPSTGQQVHVPRGYMAVLGGWCWHAAGAACGVTPRLHGVVRPCRMPEIRPGTLSE